MARPRVFVSSTYYDLKHIRSSLEVFINSIGYDSILSEKGDIAYTPDITLDESCYREAQTADIYVLIIGGRYGSEISQTKTQFTKGFYDRYESITKQEYKSAAEKDVPVYVLIEKSVYSEYQTFRRNRENKEINYAHVDSLNIFLFIEEILVQPRNNPIHTFERYSEIESWLRDQWAGLFRELIQRTSSQRQLSSLTAEVSELREVNKTLKRYLEALLVSETPEKSAELISAEDKRLEDVINLSRLRNTDLFEYYGGRLEVDDEVLLKAFLGAKNAREFLNKLAEHSNKGKEVWSSVEDEDDMRVVELWFNKAQSTVKEPSIEETSTSNMGKTSSKKRATKKRAKKSKR